MADRQFIMSSPLVAALNTDADEVATVTLSEPGVCHFDQMVTYASDPNDLAGYNQTGLTEAIQVSGLLWNGAEQLIRGRNAAAPPGSAFSPLRQASIVRLGDYSGQTGDTLAMTAQVQGSNIANGILGFGFAFSPRNRRLGYTGPIPSGRPSYAGSPTSGTIAAAAAANVTFTADADGIIDLSGLIIRCTLDQAGNGAYGPADLGGLVVTQITLPSGDTLILGTGTGGAPAQAWRGNRAHNFVDFGMESMAAGSTIILGVTNNAPDIAEVSFGFPFYPSNGKTPC